MKWENETVITPLLAPKKLLRRGKPTSFSILRH